MAATVLTLYFAREILIPLALALTLNFLLYPVVNLVQKLHISRVPAVIIVMVGFFGAAGTVGWIVAKQLVVVADNLPDLRFTIRSKLAVIHAPEEGPVGQAIKSVTDVVSELSGVPSSTPTQPPPPAVTRVERNRRRSRDEGITRVQVVQPPVGDLQYLRNGLTPLVRPVGTAIIVLVFTIFMLVEREDLRNRILLLAGVSRISLMTQALDDATTRISRYLVMQFLVNTGYGVLFGTGLYLLGLPNSTLCGVLVVILRMIPYVGILTAVAFPIFLSIAIFPSWLPTLIILLLFGVLEVIIANFVEPWLYGNKTGISSLALLVSAIFWTLIWGWPGLVLATPLTVCVIVLAEHVPQMSFLQILLGHEAELSPAATLYQRLLATDQKEARSIAESFVRDRQLVELFDEVLIPCLRFAEEDRHKGELEATRGTFLFSTVTELVAEFSEYAASRLPELDGESSEDAILGRPRKVSAMITMATDDRADELTASMLAQVLDQAGYKTMLLPLSYQSDELLQNLSNERTALVCVSALPPFAFANARALCQKLREKLPRDRIFLGMWGSAEETDRLKAGFGQVPPDHVCTTLADMIEQINRSDEAAAGKTAEILSEPV